MQYVTLMSVVSLFLDEHSKQGMYDRDRIWVLAFRALEKLNQEFAARPKTLRIPKNANQTVTLPLDYVTWTKIGLVDSNGEISTLKVNNALTTYADNSPQRLQKLAQTQVNDNIDGFNNNLLWLNYYYNGGYVNLYGVGNGVITHGECKVDEKNNVIIMPPDFLYDSILLEYQSSPERDPDYQVQSCLKEPIIAFINAKLKLGTMQEFYGEATVARRHLKPVKLQVINQVIRESQSMKLRS